MKWQVIFFHFWLLLFSQHLLAHCSDEIDNSIAAYFLQKADMDEKLSVNIKATFITDTPAKEGEDLGLAAINKFQRLMIAKQGSVQRLDAKIVNLLAKKEAVKKVAINQESQLLLEHECLYVDFQLAPEAINRFETRAGVVPMKTSSRRKHPLDLPISISNDCLFEKSTGIFYHRGNLIDEKLLADGRKKILMVPENKLGAWEIVFAHEPDWLPEKIRVIARGNVPLPQNGKIDAEQVGKWTPIATTVTVWKKHQDYPYWLPNSVRMEATENGIDQTREFLFDNWKFGDDVDSELLDKSNFTPKLIQQQVDFDEIIKKFELMGTKP